MISDFDRSMLARAVTQAEQALESGDEPFGSVLVSADGEILFEDHNHVAGGNYTRHPELAIAQWSAENLTVQQRAAATVYTSGEHCPMCAAAHAWVGLGRIVYASSSEQLSRWLAEMGVGAPPVRPLPIQEIAPGVTVEGPDPQLAERVRDLHRRRQGLETTNQEKDE
ncbi:nucleoside deaminase [Marinobacter sp. chi1]|uniref:Nucleoside deaminase n=1 Tax=Marinobacter suaedae TaxID=3057675 RepID=A0ABT8VX65_9GAMM|nr:nucleoside deaminase [Marinobacter sp. chi1]MDO3720554.1 nucleoside deaminase [Marinobacter sp. chi1]